VFAVAIYPIVQRVVGRWTPTLVGAGALVLAIAIPALYGEVYYRTAHDHVSSPSQIVSILRDGNGYVYSMYPAFALWSGREPYPWHYATDSMIARISGRLGDDDFVQVFSGSQALVLWPNELATYERARAYVDRHFTIAYTDAYYTLWVRSDAR
jgi:hypothetical protein